MANYKVMSADGVVKSSAGKLKGFFCSAASATPSLKLWDNGTAGSGTALIDTFTPVAGTYYGPMDMYFNNGLYVDVTNTVTITVEYE